MSPAQAPFRDRFDGGRALALRLGAFRDRHDTVILALPRGGVPVAFEIAKALDLPLDVFLVRKLGVPGHEEYAMGALAEGGVRIVNPEAQALGLTDQAIAAVAAAEQVELERRQALYRGGRPLADLTGKIVILVDDGLATGSTMRAAALAVRRHSPARVVVAVPVAAESTVRELAREVDEVVCVMTPEPFVAVGLWYTNFDQTSDAQVRDLLHQQGATA